MASSKIAVVQPPQVDHGTQTVEIIVGAERKSFIIHTELLFATAPVFRDFFTSGFSDRLPSTDTIRAESDGWGYPRNLIVPHEDPLLFQLFRDWLYSGCVPDNVSRYIMAGDPCYEDVFWWRVVKLAERLQIDRLTVLAVGELECIFSQDQATVPSPVFVTSVFEEPTWALQCWGHHIVLHAAFWLERSADRSIWLSLLNSHKDIPVALLTALVGKKIVHPQQGFPRGLCSDNCPHSLANRYDDQPQQPWPMNRALPLTRAKLITEDPLDNPALSEDICDYRWGSGAGHVSEDKGHFNGNWDDSSGTEEPVVATPSQSSIPPPPNFAAPPPPSQPQQSSWSFLTSLEAGQHQNIQHIQDFSEEYGGPINAELIERFKKFLLSETSTQHGGQGSDNKQAAPIHKQEGNTACTAPNNDYTTADYSAGSWGSAPGPVKSGWVTHHEHMHPANHFDTPRYVFRVVDEVADKVGDGCTACGHGNPPPGNQAVADQSQPNQQQNPAGAAWGGAYPGPSWNSCQSKADNKHVTTDGWTYNQGWDNSVSSRDQAGMGWE